MAAPGFTGVVIPAEFGGGGSCIDATVLLEELGRSSLAIASLLNFVIGFGAFALMRFGTADQKQFFLTRRSKLCDLPPPVKALNARVDRPRGGSATI